VAPLGVAARSRRRHEDEGDPDAGPRDVRIALVSYEFPPDTHHGGIATYTAQAARMLAARGHGVEVFAGSDDREGTWTENGFTVHRVRCETGGVATFRRRIGDVLCARHETLGGFDVLETPEVNGEAVEGLRRLPRLPFVVRLHTPTYLVAQISDPPWGWLEKFRFVLGSLLRRQWPRFPETPKAADRFERAVAAAADEVVGPSSAIAERVGVDWRLPADRLAVVPNVFTPQQALLQLAPGAPERRVVFVGRLEPRKGVHHLAQAIPVVLRRHPEVRFRFVGRNVYWSARAVRMQQHIESVCAGCQSSLEFVGEVTQDQLPGHLASGAIAIVPSTWENFPNVCLEAMSAARAVIGSSAGGMRDMLAEGAGVLIPPGNPRAIADAICRLLEDPALVKELAHRGRQRVLASYGAPPVAPLQEQSYARAMARRQAAGPRPPDALPPLPAS
jgi:glycosyltransferase involved in cell wall biosynthesis